MVQGSVAPNDPAAARGISRRTQSEIYRPGISGTRPRVPVDAAALEVRGPQGAERRGLRIHRRAARAPSEP